MKNFEKYGKALGYGAIYILLFLLFRQQITDLLWDANQKWLANCDETVGGILILGLTVVVVWKLLERYKNCLFGHHLLSGWLFGLFLYLYFRCDTTFNLWGIDIKGTDYRLPYLGISCVLLTLIALGQQIYANTRSGKLAKNQEDSSNILRDDPIKNSKDDLLGYTTIVQSILLDIKGVDLKEKSFSVGITGEWGMGKSSLFNIFKEELDKQGDAIVYFFNPRSSASIENIQQDFFDGFAEVLSPYHSGVHRAMGRYQDALQIADDNWFTRLVSAFSSWSTKVGMGRMNDIIKETGRRIYVFIDDLDRLTASEILEVMKLIDRNGGFVNTIFITAYDKTYVNTVLRRFLKTGKTSDFTDKYFSYELSLPVQKTEDLDKFAKKQIEKSKIYEKGDVTSDVELLKQWEDVSEKAIESLRTLRHVKRYINILLTRYEKVKEDVDFKDFAYLTLLRYKDIQVYHAIVEGKLLQQGNNLTGGSLQQYYLKADYEEELKKIARWDESGGILCELFKKVDVVDPQMVTCYHRLRHVSSFANYYYDYQKGGIYFRDLIKLYQVDTDEEAFTLMKELLGYDEDKRTCSAERYQSVEDFLLLRPLKVFGSLRDVKRLVMLLPCLIKYSWRSVDVETFITTLMFKQTAKELADRDIAGTEDEYQIELEAAIEEALKIFPLQMGYVLMLINMGLNENMGKVSDIMISQNTIIGWLEWCQKLYIQEIGLQDDKETLAKVTELSKIFRSKRDKQVTKSAQAEFVSYITAHAKVYADFICLIYRQQPLEQIMAVCYNHQYFMPDYFFPYDGMSFSDWIKENVANNGLKNILLYLDSSKTHIINVDLKAEEKGVLESNYDAVWRIIQRQNEESEENAVMKAMNNHIALSISLISQETKLSKETVRRVLQRLMNKKLVEKRLSNMADDIPPFEQGDFVSVKSNPTKQKDESIKALSVGVYKIATIKGGKARLAGVGGDVQLEFLEAVPIDGVHDRNIYYDPDVAESDGSVSHSPDIYYMHSFESMFDNDGKSYSEIVKERSYHFVHEIQHWLHEEGDYGLKINREGKAV